MMITVLLPLAISAVTGGDDAVRKYNALLDILFWFNLQLKVRNLYPASEELTQSWRERN